MPVEMLKPTYPVASARKTNGAEDEDQEVEEDEIDPKAHEKLIDGINNLTGSHFIREVTRTEPTLNRSEFGLSKSQKDKVKLKELSKFFKKSKKHTDVVKQLEKLKSHLPLQKPLEKPAADRLAREQGYKRAQKRLDRWEPVVTAVDVAAQITYPLQQGKVEFAPPKTLSQYRVKTKLMEDIEELEKEFAGTANEAIKPPDTSGAEVRKYRLTAQEMHQRQLERAFQKRLESYQIVKGRRQNKIKSKKYHRLLKKDKLKEQMKRFEELKEKDPEEALKQLDQIEKQRFTERATLRHKNTGTWAKNLQVRAKYDTDVRRELAEQLAIGRELTARRLQQDASSSESDGEQGTGAAPGQAGENPWTERDDEAYKAAAAATEQQKLVGYYRRYWEERNRVQALKKQFETNDGTEEPTNGEINPDFPSEDEGEVPGQSTSSKLTKKGRKKKKETIRMASGSWDVEDVEEQIEKPKKKASKSSTKAKAKERMENEPDVSTNVEELFQEAEELIQDALEGRLDRVRHSVAQELNDTKRPVKQQDTEQPEPEGERNRIDLSFKKKPRLADADMELHETTDRNASGGGLELALKDVNVAVSKSTATNATTGTLTTSNPATGRPTASAEINLNQVVQMKPKHLLTALPNTVTVGELSDEEPEEDDDDRQRLTIAEAFQDDDIVADFEKEKRDERQKHLPQEVDLSLPGWGQWGGPGVVPRKPRQDTRTMLKMPAQLPRRDDNLEQVIINEDALVNPALKNHLVNEVPFPYVTVKDYEASLRAPLGRTFLPETAHVTMIEPRIVTKTGTIIEPMRKKMLLANRRGLASRAPARAGKKAVGLYNKFVKKLEQGKPAPKE